MHPTTRPYLSWCQGQIEASGYCCKDNGSLEVCHVLANTGRAQQTAEYTDVSSQRRPQSSSSIAKERLYVVRPSRSQPTRPLSKVVIPFPSHIPFVACLRFFKRCRYPEKAHNVFMSANNKAAVSSFRTTILLMVRFDTSRQGRDQTFQRKNTHHSGAFAGPSAKSLRYLFAVNDIAALPVR